MSRERVLDPQFHSDEQAVRASQFGMWIFLSTEVLFFGALFVSYVLYRTAYPEAFRAAAQSQLVWAGTLNTALLLTSSFFVALGDRLVRAGWARWCGAAFGAAAALGLGFLAVKGVEYAHHVANGELPGFWFRSAVHTDAGAVMFVTLYWLMTGLHGIHVLIGIAVLGWIAWNAIRGAYGARYHTPVELSGMYWHFVDIVWVFLYPLFYLL